MIANDLYTYTTAKGGTCQNHFKRKWLGNLLFFLSRSISDYLWTIPIIFVFMPKVKFCCCDKSSKDEVNVDSSQ